MVEPATALATGVAQLLHVTFAGPGWLVLKATEATAVALSQVMPESTAGRLAAPLFVGLVLLTTLCLVALYLRPSRGERR